MCMGMYAETASPSRAFDAGLAPSGFFTPSVAPMAVTYTPVWPGHGAYDGIPPVHVKTSGAASYWP
jgi:hypothetical protein